MTSLRAVLRFTFALPDADPIRQAENLREAIRMAQFGEERGISMVTLDEHHVTEFGWQPNPVLTSGMFMAATQQIRTITSATLAPLWNPVRLAEDIAVVDQMGQGRSSFVLGLGYRPIEYSALGVEKSRRGKLLDETLEVLLQAWTGEPFDYRGQTIRVTPIPFTRLHPPVMVGGSAQATAERAVRFDLPLHIPDHLPELEAHYRQLCTDAGVTPRVVMIPEHRPGMVFLHEDPDEAWATLGEYLCWEAIEYSAWAQPDMTSVMHVRDSLTPEQIRSSGRYQVMSPDEAVQHILDHGPQHGLTMHPLLGGMPLDEAWKSVQLLTDVVIPAVAATAS